MDRPEVEEVIEPVDCTVVAHEPIDASAEDGAARADRILKDAKDELAAMEWDAAAIARLRGFLIANPHIGTITNTGANEVRLADSRGNVLWGFPRSGLREPPPAVEAPSERHTCFEWKRCADCGRLFKSVLGEPLP